jgi:hypothetical protein
MSNLLAHIKAENKATQEWIDAADGRWGGMIVEDLNHWTSKGITTVEQYDQYMRDATYSDLYKEVYGTRPRHVGHVSQVEFDDLLAAHDAHMVIELAQQDADIAAFEQLVTDTMAMGNIDRKTAIRWLQDADSDYADESYFCFCHNLPYNYFNDKMAHAA